MKRLAVKENGKVKSVCQIKMGKPRKKRKFLPQLIPWQHRDSNLGPQEDTDESSNRSYGAGGTCHYYENLAAFFM